ncbi:c-type cytochrome [Maribacter sp. HTCC2170]|uniref:c-type cytochrome n=1 Tax=Maribacter sp. (strain HTCC2170 / KCCM 42371) TaxID=313603 RepID=UPI00006AFCBF|nr:c-type cytochrome [Maribacter sp. HTCC2170]EAR01377.1 cytochrome c552 [Maribacter sp. HTCC2170]
MRLISFFIMLLMICSCNRAKKPEEVKDNSVPARAELSKDSKIFLGNRLFSEKTCITCHAVDQKKIGPSVVEIMTVYKGKSGDIVSFLKGKSEPIVDTTASQVAIMQANIEGFLRDISDVELDAIETYMLHVDKLNAN